MGRKFGWHSGKLICKDLDVQQTINLGTLDFGAAELDSIIIKGRISTSSVAGAALSLGSGYTYSELMEMRCTLTSWTGVAAAFKGYYFRAEMTANSASYGFRGMEIISTLNTTSGTTAQQSFQGVYMEANLKHGSANWTLNGDGAVLEVTPCIYDGAGTLTVTNDFPAIKVKVQGGSGVNDYTKFNGISIYARDGASASRVFGDAISIEDPSDAYASDWTNAIAVSADVTTVLNVTSSCAATTIIDINPTSCTRGIRLGTHDWGAGITGIEISETDPLFQVAGKVTGANVAAGVYACEYEQLALTSSQNLDVSMFASWNELYITTAGTINLTGSSHYAAVKGHVEVTGTVTSSTGTTASLWGSNIIPAAYTNNGTIAGCTVDMILNNGYTDNGIIAAYAIGAHTDPGQNKIPIGLYMPYNAIKRGLLMGSPWAGTGSTGLKILTDNTTWSTGATVGIYFDDGGSALTAWGEGFTVGQAVLTASTEGAQTGWPYTAFFYLDIEANITTATAQHWANVMTSAIIGSGVTVDGFTSHGVSSLHTSCDINGTLSANNTMSNISFGGNSTGTVDGHWVCMHVRDTTGNFTAWTKFDTNATGCYTTSYTGNAAFVPNNKGTFTQTGQLRIMVGGDTYYIPYGTVA